MSRLSIIGHDRRVVIKNLEKWRMRRWKPERHGSQQWPHGLPADGSLAVVVASRTVVGRLVVGRPSSRRQRRVPTAAALRQIGQERPVQEEQLDVAIVRHRSVFQYKAYSIT